MLRIRPVALDDIDSLLRLTGAAGIMTTLPKTAEGFRARVESSLAAFARADRDPLGEAFFMVLEDTENGALLGTTAIYTNLGEEKAFYNYRLTRVAHHSRDLGIRHLARVLVLANDYTGATEVGTLFLAPEARGRGAAHLLSRCRFMLMALKPEKFDSVVVAEMRGWLDENGDSPFWEAVGKRFFHLPFDRADAISGASDNQFIADLMPKLPVYADLLPEAAQDAIGRLYRDSEAAAALLQHEGLRFNNAVDIFDAGPILDAPLDRIRTVRTAKRFAVSAIAAAEPESGRPHLVARPDFAGFRCVMTPAFSLSGNEAVLDRHAAAALGVSTGDSILAAEV